ncbi:MAG: copper amine oxidase N-terminal domain-containing protein [Dictyoglomi bacterium]|nr:copper amine oxidase N-terminal domain-containing protein [Dictyoglomota bacterium]
MKRGLKFFIFIVVLVLVFTASWVFASDDMKVNVALKVKTSALGVSGVRDIIEISGTYYLVKRDGVYAYDQQGTMKWGVTDLQYEFYTIDKYDNDTLWVVYRDTSSGDVYAALFSTDGKKIGEAKIKQVTKDAKIRAFSFASSDTAETRDLLSVLIRDTNFSGIETLAASGGNIYMKWLKETFPAGSSLCSSDIVPLDMYGDKTTRRLDVLGWCDSQYASSIRIIALTIDPAVGDVNKYYIFNTSLTLDKIAHGVSFITSGDGKYALLFADSNNNVRIISSSFNLSGDYVDLGSHEYINVIGGFPISKDYGVFVYHYKQATSDALPYEGDAFVVFNMTASSSKVQNGISAYVPFYVSKTDDKFVEDKAQLDNPYVNNGWYLIPSANKGPYYLKFYAPIPLPRVYLVEQPGYLSDSSGCVVSYSPTVALNVQQDFQGRILLHFVSPNAIVPISIDDQNGMTKRVFLKLPMNDGEYTNVFVQSEIKTTDFLPSVVGYSQEEQWRCIKFIDMNKIVPQLQVLSSSISEKSKFIIKMTLPKAFPTDTWIELYKGDNLEREIELPAGTSTKNIVVYQKEVGLATYKVRIKAPSGTEDAYSQFSNAVTIERIEMYKPSISVSSDTVDTPFVIVNGNAPKGYLQFYNLSTYPAEKIYRVWHEGGNFTVKVPLQKIGEYQLAVKVFYGDAESEMSNKVQVVRIPAPPQIIAPPYVYSQSFSIWVSASPGELSIYVDGTKMFTVNHPGGTKSYVITVFNKGKHTVQATIKVNGYTSKLSDPVVVEYPSDHVPIPVLKDVPSRTYDRHVSFYVEVNTIGVVEFDIDGKKKVSYDVKPGDNKIDLLLNERGKHHISARFCVAGNCSDTVDFVIEIYDKIEIWIGRRDYILNGQKGTMDVAPFIDPAVNRTVVPLRFVLEAMGFEVKWDSHTRTIRITGEIFADNGEKFTRSVYLYMPKSKPEMHGTYEVYPGSSKVKIEDEGKQAYMIDLKNYKGQNMGVPFIYQNRTFVPVRFISEIFGAKVFWDGAERKVTIER